MKKQKTLSTITTLRAFYERHKLSYQQLSDICGNAPNCSRTQMSRLVNDQIEDKKIEAEMRLILAKNLPQFLFNLGLSAAEIDHQLTQIFNKGEYKPMITQRTVLPKPVQQFFNLSDDPFSKPPRHRSEVFLSPALKDVFDQVIDGIKYQGFKYVSGEIGSGKSVLRSLIEEHIASQSNLRLIFPETFDMARVTPANISRAILEEFESSHIPNDAVSRAKKVKNVLSRAYKEGTRVAIAFDECHRLNDTAISSLKNFLEMNSGGFQKYLGVILFGQPSFETRLGEPRFREIFERITPIKMPSFKESAFDYLQKRIALVNGDITELFDQDALDLILQNSETPLALGNIVNSAFIHSVGFKNKKVIGAAIRTKMFFAESREPKELSKRAGK